MGRWAEQQTTAPKTRWQAAQSLNKPTFMTGSWWEKVFDPLLAGQYAIAGLGRKAAGLDDAGAIEGIKHRVSWVDTIQEKYPYEPSTDWKKNFLQEIKRVAPGILGDVVLDPFVGSGTSVLAAKALGRKYIGIDVLEEYCKLTEEELKIRNNQELLAWNR